ncbi:MAG: TetR family transcriptional regulator [Pseudomonadota bacterium]
MAEKLKRAQLSKDTILSAAIIVARREGVDFTMRALGKELNAWPNVVYDHFPTKLELQHALLDLIIDGALTDDVVARFVDTSEDWGERLKTFSLELFDHLSKYRGVGHLITHHGAAGPPNVVRLVTLCLNHLMEKGLSLERATIIFQVLTFFAAEMGDLEAATRDGLITINATEAKTSKGESEDAFQYFMRTSITIPVRERLRAGLDLFIAAVIAETSVSTSA